MAAIHERLRSRRGNEAETIVSHKIRLVTSAATRFMIPMRAKFGVEAIHEPDRKAQPLRSIDCTMKTIEAGEGTVEITPPLGIELAGFHKPPGKERVVTGIRQPCLARALVLRLDKTEIALVSLDVCGFPRDFAERIRRRAGKRTGLGPSNIRVTATHTHSAPTLRFFRQWGAVSKPYVQFVEDRAVQAIEFARKDLAPADCYLGRQTVTDGNFNRTSKTWKTEDAFNAQATDENRWLDRTLHALLFMREQPKQNLLWYNFSAHPVCYTDGLAGPDWPGLVAEKMKARDGLTPSFLQGHCGDVNPGNGETSLGDPEKVSEAIYSALHHATNHSSYVQPTELRSLRSEASLPLDIDLLKDQLQRYRTDPSKCTRGEWVDAGFAEDWFADLSKWNLRKTAYSAPISALRLGALAFVFHPGELYGFYGLAIRLASPFANTIVVGYADDFVGYLPDPPAFKAGEYAALVVPKLLGLPSYRPEAARTLAAAAAQLLRKLAS